jgi:hypothetical protein
MPTSRAEFVRRRGEVHLLRAALRRANVPEAAANEIVEDLKLVAYVTGYVYDVYTEDDGTTHVQIKGLAYGDNLDATDYGVSFPPNRPEHLAELIRAQSHPHLRVFLTTWRKPNENSVISDLHVVLDYYDAPLDNAPPFDVRTLSSPASPPAVATVAVSKP